MITLMVRIFFSFRYSASWIHLYYKGVVQMGKLLQMLSCQELEKRMNTTVSAIDSKPAAS